MTVSTTTPASDAVAQLDAWERRWQELGKLDTIDEIGALVHDLHELVGEGKGDAQVFVRADELLSRIEARLDLLQDPVEAQLNALYPGSAA